jgi:hypothetical protein
MQTPRDLLCHLSFLCNARRSASRTHNSVGVEKIQVSISCSKQTFLMKMMIETIFLEFPPACPGVGIAQSV